MTDVFAHLPHHGAYRIIYADPPWAFETWSHRGQGKGASKHYATQGLDWLKSLPVGALAAPDAALFVWVVQPLLPQAFELMRAWGFDYKTIAYGWVKTKDDPGNMLFWDEAWDQSATRLGLGYHTRSGAEQCWLATRGKGYERLSKAETQVVHAARREHSRKPDSIAESIVRLAEGPRVELFARTTRPGFDVWGNEINKFAGGASLAARDDGARPPAERPAERQVEPPPSAPAGGDAGGPVGESGHPATHASPPEPDSHLVSSTSAGASQAPWRDTEDLLEIPAFLRREKARA